MKVIAENLPPFYARECSVAAFKNFLKNTFVPNSGAQAATSPKLLNIIWLFYLASERERARPRRHQHAP
jgi:hypothetical protein